MSREEFLEKKKVAARLRYQKIKRDPSKLEVLREKERLKYLKKRESGQRKLVSEMSPYERKIARRNWRLYNSCRKKAQSQNQKVI